MYERLTGEVVFAVTPAGHAELQWRRMGVAKPLRFLMRLINGERNVDMLRIVSETVRDDDEPFRMLLDLGLIRDVASADDTAVQSAASVSYSEDAGIPAARSAPDSSSPFRSDAAALQSDDRAAETVPVRAGIDPQQRMQVVAILRRALQSDAEKPIKNLLELGDEPSFHGFVQRLHRVLREQISRQLAEELATAVPAALPRKV
jgi:D-serine deaminase-like pyridoxal phosphate-dependent protein